MEPISNNFQRLKLNPCWNPGIHRARAKLQDLSIKNVADIVYPDKFGAICYWRALCRRWIVVWGSNLRLSGITHNVRYPSAPLGLARCLLLGKLPVSTLLLHRLCTTSQRHHTQRLPSSRADYHLVEGPSQKIVVDLGSRAPSLALDTTLAPENPRTKEDWGLP